MTRDRYSLDPGSRVGVIGGGPAGSFFSYFLLTMASRVGYEVEVDIYEPRDFTRPGPAGCNMCGGIVYESLIQLLAMEGIVLPPDVVQRGIDSYVLHMDRWINGAAGDIFRRLLIEGLFPRVIHSG